MNNIQPQNAAGAKTAKSPENPLLPPQVPPAPKNSKKTHTCKPDMAPLWKMVLEVGAVIVGLYVAWVYSGQLAQMIESNKINKEAFESVQRAFLVCYDISQDRFRIHPNPKETEGVWSFTMPCENTGTT